MATPTAAGGGPPSEEPPDPSAVLREEFGKLSKQLREDVRMEVQKAMRESSCGEMMAPVRTGRVRAWTPGAAAGAAGAEELCSDLMTSVRSRIRAWGHDAAGAEGAASGKQLKLPPPISVPGELLSPHSQGVAPTMSRSKPSVHSLLSPSHMSHAWTQRHRRSFSGMQHWHRTMELESLGFDRLTGAGRWLRSRLSGRQDDEHQPPLSRAGTSAWSDEEKEDAPGSQQPAANVAMQAARQTESCGTAITASAGRADNTSKKQKKVSIVLRRATDISARAGKVPEKGEEFARKEDEPKTLLTSSSGKLRRSLSGQPRERAMGLTPMRSKDFSTEVAEGELRRRARNVVTHPLFQLLVQAGIIANAIHIGVQTDTMATQLSLETSVFDATVNSMFCALFAVEVAMRMFVFREKFFTMWGCWWNVFDLILVLMQTVEECLFYSGGMASLPNSTVLRLSRLLRVVKIVRLLRLMRYFEDLRLLVCCILHSAKPFFWAVALIMMIIYVFSNYVTHIVIVDHIDAGLPAISHDPLLDYYGSVSRSVLSLFQGISGGVDWRDLVDPLLERPSLHWAAAGMLFYLSFAILGIMNVVTGTFVQQAMERSNEVKEIHRVAQARKLFKSLDFDASGYITFEEIHDHLFTPAVQSFLESIDVDISEARCLFEVMDMSGAGSIDFEEFLSACLRLQGPARALDLILLTRDCRRFFEQHSSLLEQIAKCLIQESADLPGAEGEEPEPKEEQPWNGALPHVISAAEAAVTADAK